MCRMPDDNSDLPFLPLLRLRKAEEPLHRLLDQPSSLIRSAQHWRMTSIDPLHNHILIPFPDRLNHLLLRPRR
jgi:hypothetical protein